MHRKMTIPLDEVVYEDLLRPHVVDTSLDAGYQAMAADQAREAEAQEWSNALSQNIADAAR